MQRDRAYFFDILDSAKLAVKYISELTYEEFIKNTAIQDAVIRRIEILGEAAGRISSESKNKYDQLP